MGLRWHRDFTATRLPQPGGMRFLEPMFSISRCLSFVLLSGLILGALDAAELPAMTNRFVVIAHRGEHLRHQENTLEAIEGAIAAGADFVEIDLRRSRDGVYLLMHDRTVDRMTTGQGAVASLKWAELSALSVRDRRLTQVPPSRIPKFTEALRACHGRIRIYLDFKDGDRAETAKLIREAGCERDVNGRWWCTTASVRLPSGEGWRPVFL